jgi:hypothetical protein
MGQFFVLLIVPTLTRAAKRGEKQMFALRPRRGHLEIFDEFRRGINASYQQALHQFEI